MIYAKFINENQIVTDKKELEKRNGTEENAVYCEGEVSIGKYENLCSVPLNYIFSCLKYGNKIAIVESSDLGQYLQSDNYPDASSYSNYIVGAKTQKINKILDLTAETVEYIFEQVNNPELIPDNGYITNLEYVPFDVCVKFYELKGKKVPEWVKK